MDRNMLHEAAVRLAEYGYRVFPCKPGSKTPATPNGFYDSTTDEDVIGKWWAANPHYNVAVYTEGLCVVDVDPIEDGLPNDWMRTLSVEQVESLQTAPQTISPRRGIHLWFRQPAGMDLRISTSKIAKKVDTRANGGYVLVPPSKITEHGIYVYAPFRDLDCGPEGLPELPEWIVELLEQKERPAPVESDDPDIIPDGKRNSTLASIAGRLRQIGLDASAIDAALQRINQLRCRPPLSANEVSKIARSVARYEPDQTAQAIAEGWANDFLEGDDEEQDDPPDDPGKFPQHLLNVGGILGQIIEYNLKTAHRRQPELALAGALCLLATITGRKVEDEYKTRTNLYMIALCPAGGGKDHARKLNKEILSAAGMIEYIGNEDFKSGSGFLVALSQQQSLLFQIDELGKWLQQISERGNGAGFLRDVIKQLLTVYTSSRSIVKTGAQADASRVKTIQQPHAVIYSTSIPDNVLHSLTAENLHDGFLSRTLIIESASGRTPEQVPAGDELPESILEYVKWWGAYNPAGNVNDLNPIARKMHTVPEGADLYRELSKLADEQQDRWPQFASLWVRAGEMARKLAIIHQLSLDKEATEVGLVSVAWACEFIEYAIGRAVFLAHEWVADGKYEKLLKRIIRVVREAGGPVSRSRLSRVISNVPAKEISEAIERLLLDGRLVKGTRKTGGRPADTYDVRRRP